MPIHALYALSAALLFGLATPLAKLLLVSVSPLMLAALLYLGSGLGLALVRLLRREAVLLPQGREWLWLGGAILAGGVAGPVLLMFGLAGFSASGASLLLNAESALTALLAWCLFKENFDRSIALGMLAIVAGALVLGWPSQGGLQGGSLASAGLIVAACLAWAVDNNLTRKVSLADAGFIAMAKGLVAGSVSLLLAFAMGAALPPVGVAAQAALLGFASYGVSLVLFVLALRHLGTARTGAYFAVAPFAGALLSVWLLDEPVTLQLLLGGALMAVGVLLHLAESHAHPHTHAALEHDHSHTHGDDTHHSHTHAYPVPAGTRHAHPHRHTPLVHTHPHFPDAHHRHSH
ncbi:EamA family transporter [Rhodoferax sp.]|uniref:DMT family transporter n=1 Tax=Rhodoferax sp. TaxID=50421 RepID=UPI00374DB9FE